TRLRTWRSVAELVRVLTILEKRNCHQFRYSRKTEFVTGPSTSNSGAVTAARSCPALIVRGKFLGLVVVDADVHRRLIIRCSGPRRAFLWCCGAAGFPSGGRLVFFAGPPAACRALCRGR